VREKRERRHTVVRAEIVSMPRVDSDVFLFFQGRGICTQSGRPAGEQKERASSTIEFNIFALCQRNAQRSTEAFFFPSSFPTICLFQQISKGRTTEPACCRFFFFFKQISILLVFSRLRSTYTGEDPESICPESRDRQLKAVLRLAEPGIRSETSPRVDC
jgi:hypothetical protein